MNRVAWSLLFKLKLHTFLEHYTSVQNPQIITSCSSHSQLSNVQGVDQTSLAEILSHLPDNPPPVIMQATQQLLQRENIKVEQDNSGNI